MDGGSTINWWLQKMNKNNITKTRKLTGIDPNGLELHKVLQEDKNKFCKLVKDKEKQILNRIMIQILLTQDHSIILYIGKSKM